MTASVTRPALPDSAPAGDRRQARRLAFLERVIRRWIGSHAARAPLPLIEECAIPATVARWLRRVGDGPLFAAFPGLVADLQGQPRTACPANAPDFERAFADQLLRQACSDIAREAGRAGRADALACLQPHLRESPDAAERARLADALQLSPEAIDLALASLRRRLRERVESALDLWASTPDSRDTLRRQLRAALTEQTP